MDGVIITSWAAEHILDSNHPLEILEQINLPLSRECGVRFVSLRGEHHQAIQGLSSYGGKPPVWKDLSILQLPTIKLDSGHSEFTKSLAVIVVQQRKG